MSNPISGLAAETAKIPWKELQRFYAQGKVFHVSDELDLVEIATAFSEDNVAKVKQLMLSGGVQSVHSTQALAWFESDALVWAVTVAPFVLVQSLVNKP